VAEGGGLLNRYTPQRRIQGSNPCVSASFSGSESLDPTDCPEINPLDVHSGPTWGAYPSIGRLLTPLDRDMETKFLFRLNHRMSVIR
jgi:hypothetical protein